jgi:hypothetical protein
MTAPLPADNHSVTDVWLVLTDSIVASFDDPDTARRHAADIRGRALDRAAFTRDPALRPLLAAWEGIPEQEIAWTPSKLDAILWGRILGLEGRDVVELP